MDVSWLPRAAVPIAVATSFALLRRFAPPKTLKREPWTCAHRQKPEPLPPGAIGGLMCLVGAALLSTFFVFRGMNSAWARWQDPGMVHIGATQALWFPAPFLAALTVPWPLVVWSLRKWGRVEADEINERASEQSGFDSYTAMKWMSLGLAGPAFLLTLLAVPIHLSVGDHEAKLGRYASMTEDTFDLRTATGARVVERRQVDNHKVQILNDLVIDFPDGRHLTANAPGGGGTIVDPLAIQLLLAHTHLTPVYPGQQAAPNSGGKL